MANRENQGYVMGIIGLSIVAVMLLVTTVFLAIRMSDYHDKMVAAQGDAKFRSALSDAYAAKSDMLSACLGVEGKAVDEIEGFRDLIPGYKRGVEGTNQSNEIQQIADSANGIYEIYTRDMAFNSAITDSGENNTEADQTYKGTIDKMASALRSATENAFAKAQETNRIRDESETQIASVTNTLQERTKALTETEEKLAEEGRRNTEEEKRLAGVAKSLQDAMDVQRVEFDNQKEELQGMISTISDEKKVTDKENAGLKAKVNNYEREVFDIADGKIVRVAESSNSVFIDLGRVDGVRPNLTFVIYDRAASDYKKDRHKAMIEITEVLDNGLSRGRITDTDPLNPILTGDIVLSATFDRGDTVAVALGGFFDLDNDGISDVEKLKRMIVRNGGRVVASHDEDGNISGQIDSTTRFFVLGPAPRTGTRKVVTAMTTLQDQAKGNSVDTIDIRKLLTWMGQRQGASIERLDNRTGGFKSRSPGGSGTRSEGSDTRADGSGTRSLGSGTK